MNALKIIARMDEILKEKIKSTFLKGKTTGM